MGDDADTGCLSSAERNLMPSAAYVCAAVVDAEGVSSVRYPTCVLKLPENATAGMPSFAPSTAAPLAVRVCVSNFLFKGRKKEKTYTVPAPSTATPTFLPTFGPETRMSGFVPPKNCGAVV